MSVIENDTFQIHIDDTEGCNIKACFIKKGKKLLSLMPDSRAEDCSLEACSFIMAPYSNRIENGSFRFNGQSYQLERGDEHSIHGDVRQRSWQIVESSETLLHCRLNTADCEGVNWPWSFVIDAFFELHDNCFQSVLTLKNTSNSVMPAGFGWHPYFSRALSPKDQEIRMQVELTDVYPDDNGTRIPSGRLRSLREEEDFSVERVVKDDVFIDGCFYGYQGDGTLYWPGSGVRVTFDCTEKCKHAVIFTPLGKPFIAFEPVTNANNGVNLLAQGDDSAGTVPLQPGEQLSAQFDITVDFT